MINNWLICFKRLLLRLWIINPKFNTFKILETSLKTIYYLEVSLATFYPYRDAITTEKEIKLYLQALYNGKINIIYLNDGIRNLIQSKLLKTLEFFSEAVRKIITARRGCVLQSDTLITEIHTKAGLTSTALKCKTGGSRRRSALKQRVLQLDRKHVWELLMYDRFNANIQQKPMNYKVAKIDEHQWKGSHVSITLIT